MQQRTLLIRQAGYKARPHGMRDSKQRCGPKGAAGGGHGETAEGGSRLLAAGSKAVGWGRAGGDGAVELS